MHLYVFTIAVSLSILYQAIPRAYSSMNTLKPPKEIAENHFKFIFLGKNVIFYSNFTWS